MTNKPNIVFLDMDGVLCNPRACLAVGNVGGMYSYLDPIACMLVKRLCMENNARIVISSSWRLHYDMYAMQAILNANCPGLGYLMFLDMEMWRTININNCAMDKHGRGREIKDWIDKFSSKFNRFVILDDDCDMEPLMDSFVQCHAYDGIGFHHYNTADSILKGKR